MSFDRRFIAVLLVGLLMVPLFFTIQLLFVLLGWSQLTLDPQNAEHIVRATPVWALVAPALRVVILAVALVLLTRQSRWLASVALIDVIVHVTGWLSILGNPNFALPTGFITFGLQGFLLYVLIQAGHFRFEPR